MKCMVYWGSGGFVVVPECVRASREAERRYGPLLECAWIETDGLDRDLAEHIGAAIDQSTYACASADLALHTGYKASQPLPLPYGFRWECYDNIRDDQPMLLNCGWYPPVLVAELMPLGERGGWIVITNSHKAWAFRGLRVAQTRMAALNFTAAWASMNASTLRNEILRIPAPFDRPRSSLPKPRPAAFTAVSQARDARSDFRGGAYTSPAP